MYCAAVLDVYSRRIVGWSIADHLRTELVVDALEMARWRRLPPPGQTIVHSRPRLAVHRVGVRTPAARRRACSARWGESRPPLDNAMMESFFGTLQRELLDRQRWVTRAELAAAIFEWIEGWYNPRRRHTALADLSPVDYERRPTPEPDAA